MTDVAPEPSMPGLVTQVREYARSQHAGWRIIDDHYTDEQITGMLLPDCLSLRQAKEALAPIVEIYRERELARAPAVTESGG